MVNFLETLFYTLQILTTGRQKFEYPGGADTASVRQDWEYQLADLQLPPPFVTTALGNYEGYFMKVYSGRDIYAFEGIPFAEKPERFKAPQPKSAFTGNFSAKRYGQDCLQTNYAVVVNADDALFGSEDCLSCNIYSPKISTKRNPNKDEGYPVILNFYGGSFAVGSSNDYGPAYLLEKNLVLVSCNYRIGVHGFLSTGDSAASGNWGLKDAALALQWVHTHIHAFGGNPNRIILFGQSAGAALVHLLLLTPAVNGKVAGAMCFSGNAFTPFALHAPGMAKRMTWRLAVMSWCPTNHGTHAMVDCMRRRNPKVLAWLQNLVHITEEDVLQFRPVVEPNVPGALLKQNAEQSYKNGKVAKIPILFSSTSSDAETLHIVARAFRLPLWRVIKTAAVFLSNLLIFRGGPEENSKIMQSIIEFYGGVDYLAENPGKFFNMLNDGLFRMGMLKSLRQHSRVAPTYGMQFGYKSFRGIAGRLGLDPWEFETPHSEDLFYMFNRTDIEPITKSHPDFRPMQLLQTILDNFGRFGTFRYAKFNSSTKLVPLNSVDPRNNTFDMLVIGPEGPDVAKMQLQNNLTKFWDSLTYL